MNGGEIFSVYAAEAIDHVLKDVFIVGKNRFPSEL